MGPDEGNLSYVSIADESQPSRLGDVSGGLLAGLLSLPTPMALGALTYSALGDDYLAFGVVTGIAGFAVANIVSAAFGPMRVMVVGPSTPPS